MESIKKCRGCSASLYRTAFIITRHPENSCTRTIARKLCRCEEPRLLTNSEALVHPYCSEECFLKHNYAPYSGSGCRYLSVEDYCTRCEKNVDRQIPLHCDYVDDISENGHL